MNLEERKQMMTEMREKGITWQKIGNMFGVSHQRVQQIVKGYQHSRKTLSTKIPDNWKPGETKNISTSLKGRSRLTEMVRHRDNYTCQICHKKWKEGARRFDVHHLDPEKENNPLYENYKCFDEMITLCCKCHLRLEHIRKSFSAGRININKKVIVPSPITNEDSLRKIEQRNKRKYRKVYKFRNSKVKDLKTRKKNKGKAYFKTWPSYQKSLTGKPVGRPRKDKDE